MSKNFYITTTLPYVNDEPHIGFALEIIQADVIARYRTLLGNEVFFNTGTDDNGLKIYKKNYKIKYCVGCELEKIESELLNGKCPLHPNRNLEIIEEENYFFRFSRYQQALLKLYQENPEFVVPDWRLK